MGFQCRAIPHFSAVQRLFCPSFKSLNIARFKYRPNANPDASCATDPSIADFRSRLLPAIFVTAA
jgi:hypothetical protein